MKTEEELRETTVWLRITTYRALRRKVEHLYGTLIPLEGERKKVTFILDDQTAAELNRLHDCDPSSFGAYRAGQEWNGFASEESLIERAIETYREHYPHATRLVIGDPVYEIPDEIIHEVETGVAKEEPQ